MLFTIHTPNAGYGGESWLSEEEVIEEVTYDSEDNDTDDLLTDSDEEDQIKEIRRLTKENTNFNTVSLGDVIEEKKSYAHLMLGKPVVNSEGKKQTLLVTVTPFGEESSGPRKYMNSTYTSVATANGKDAAKTQPKDTKTSNVLSVYSSKNGNESVPTVDKEEKSLLDEISETLEKSNNSILGRRKTPLRETEQSSYDINNKENISKKEESEVTNKSDRKTTLTRTPALKSRDLEKPIYQTSTARIELLNSKNSRLSAPLERKQPEELNDKNNNKEEVVNSLTESDQSIPGTINSTTDFITNERNEESKSEPPNEGEVLAQSREQAGKPDGREDPKSLELPALPLTPPPTLENQTSFLHPQANGTNSTGNTTSYHPPLYEKPKIPVKPATVLIRKPVASPNINQVYQTLPLTTFVKDPLSKQDSAEGDPR